MSDMRELMMDELYAVSGGEKTTCTVTKVVEFLGITIAEAKCDNGQTIRIIQPPA